LGALGTTDSGVGNLLPVSYRQPARMIALKVPGPLLNRMEDEAVNRRRSQSALMLLGN
jgi:hypothetical protein